MKLNIPAVGARLQILQDWTFDLPNFYWNRLFWEGLFGEVPQPVKSTPVKLPAGAILTLTKIDFRPSDPYPIRFHLKRKDNPLLPACGRFWVTLSDANTLNAEVL